ncbi:MAG: tRNA 2-selenouridine(34) synthase MnmH [Bacteroidia bacterium]
MQTLSVNAFLEKIQQHPLLDVRTPAEFEAAHIPGAVNIPLFTNEERVIIGTIYKQQGKQKAILKGLDFIGPRMSQLIKTIEKISSQKTVLLHCWRGGMRSGSVAWLLGLYGFEVILLRGGYKAYRSWVLDQFKQPKKIIVLGGSTGSGKTEILYYLQKQGEQIIDLEKIACHKGSAFGAIGEKEAPSQEQFENNLATEWATADPGKRLWLEDEGRTIGRKVMPEPIWQQMRLSPLIHLDIPIQNRVDFLVEIYGKYPKAALEESILKIKKRLGGLATQQAIDALNENNLAETAEILLKYYDKTYQFGLSKKPAEQIFPLKAQTADFEEVAKELISLANKI